MTLGLILEKNEETASLFLTVSTRHSHAAQVEYPARLQCVAKVLPRCIEYIRNAPSESYQNKNAIAWGPQKAWKKKNKTKSRRQSKQNSRHCSELFHKSEENTSIPNIMLYSVWQSSTHYNKISCLIPK